MQSHYNSDGASDDDYEWNCEIAVTAREEELNPIGPDNVNYTEALERVIQTIPLMENYIGCANCGHPIALVTEIVDVVSAPRFHDVRVAYVLPALMGSRIMHNVIIDRFSQVHWRTRVYCANCFICLSILALSTHNTNIDDYIFDTGRCIILDAWSVGFYRRNMCH